MAKAKIVLAPDVFKTITYFTKNLHTEIGAVGTGSIKTENKKKYFYIDKLFFPDQNVTGATVHFKPEMWGSILKQMSKDDISRICFYWHRHPGSAAHSSTDEEDTFGTFMDKESGRSFFVFMQTACPYNSKDGEIEFESRIDIATPIRATIQHTDIDVIEEVDDKEYELLADVKIAEEKLTTYRDELMGKIKIKCGEIEKSCIKTPTYNTDIKSYFPQYSFGDDMKWRRGNTQKQDPLIPLDYKPHIFWNCMPLGLQTELEDLCIVNPDEQYVDNDYVGDYASGTEEKVSIKCENGCILVKAGQIFNKVMTNALSKDGLLKGLVRRTKVKEEKDLTHYLITPERKQYTNLKIKLLSLFLRFNKILVEQWKKEGALDVPKPDAKEIAEEYKLESEQAIEDMMDILTDSYMVLWIEESTFAQVFDSESQDFIGNIYLSDDYTRMTVTGDQLTSIAAHLDKKGAQQTAVADTSIETKLEGNTNGGNIPRQNRKNGKGRSR